MEIKDMTEKLGDHETRITKVETEQKYQRKDIDHNQSDLSRLITNNNRIQIALAMMIGSYLGWDKVMAIATRYLGG